MRSARNLTHIPWLSVSCDPGTKVVFCPGAEWSPGHRLNRFAFFRRGAQGARKQTAKRLPAIVEGFVFRQTAAPTEH
jgi:hypothetical protein